jgi:methyltransferase (TIGR00027 family)
MYILFCVLGHQPSRTAEYMALFRAVESAEPPAGRWFVDPHAVPLLSGTLKAAAQFATLPLVGRLVATFLDLGWPHTRSSAIVRTRVIDDVVRQAIRSGINQLVLLGAGFDSRAFRLEEAANIACFEVDHLATQCVKLARLKAEIGQMPENVRFVEMDFEEDNLEVELEKAGFNRHIPAMVVWEGVVSYLTEAAVIANLAVLARLLARASLLIFTYVHKGALDGSINFDGSQRWKSWVRRSGEPFIFGFAPSALAQVFQPYGFTIQSDESTADAALRYRASAFRKESGSELYRIAAALRGGE